MRVKLNKSRKRVCFTLIELVIAIVIIGILTSLGMGHYFKVIIKAKAAKAKHAISLIAAAEEIYRVDNGVYINVAYDQSNVTIGDSVNGTGMNLASVDNDTDFRYRVTGTNVIRARPRNPIGQCPAAFAGEIAYNLSTGAWNIPNCYK